MKMPVHVVAAGALSLALISQDGLEFQWKDLHKDGYYKVGITPRVLIITSFCVLPNFKLLWFLTLLEYRQSPGEVVDKCMTRIREERKKAKNEV
jgi:hypothetical protein